jgi:hypothetical protein
MENRHGSVLRSGIERYSSPREPIANFRNPIATPKGS